MQLAENTELDSLLLKAPGNIVTWNRFLAQLARQLNCDSSALLVTDLIQPEKTHFLFNAHVTQEHHKPFIGREIQCPFLVGMARTTCWCNSLEI